MPLTKQFLPGSPDERKDGRMFKPPLHGDGVEVLLELFHLADHLHSILATDFLLDHRCAGEDPMPVLSERFQCRAVVEFTHNVWMEPLVDQPLVYQPPKHGIGCREEYGGTA